MALRIFPDQEVFYIVKVGIISDIHGNFEALKSVMEDLKGYDLDALVCLGDLVGFGPHPSEVVGLVQELGIPTVKGNHDEAVCNGCSLDKFVFKSIEERDYVRQSLECTVRDLGQNDLTYLRGLPYQLEIQCDSSSILFLHSIPDIRSYPSIEDIESFIDNTTSKYVFYGHTHRHHMYIYKGNAVINVGSVGKPKHGNPMASFCIAEFDQGCLKDLSFKYKDYQFDKVCRDLLRLGYPKQTISFLQKGTG